MQRRRNRNNSLLIIRNNHLHRQNRPNPSLLTLSTTHQNIILQSPRPSHRLPIINHPIPHPVDQPPPFVPQILPRSLQIRRLVKPTNLRPSRILHMPEPVRDVLIPHHDLDQLRRVREPRSLPKHLHQLIHGRPSGPQLGLLTSKQRTQRHIGRTSQVPSGPPRHPTGHAAGRQPGQRPAHLMHRQPTLFGQLRSARPGMPDQRRVDLAVHRGHADGVEFLAGFRHLATIGHSGHLASRGRELRLCWHATWPPHRPRRRHHPGRRRDGRSSRRIDPGTTRPHHLHARRQHDHRRPGR